jgi:hypothetical protein
MDVHGPAAAGGDVADVPGDRPAGDDGDPGLRGT